MIVNLNYFKTNQDESSIGVSYFRVTNPNPRKILYALTILQFWFQLFSLLLLILSCFIQYKFETDQKFKHSKSIGNSLFYFNTSLVFQISDILLTLYATYYHFRYSTSLYTNTQNVKIWIIANYLYILSSITFFFYIYPVAGVLVVSMKGLSIFQNMSVSEQQSSPAWKSYHDNQNGTSELPKTDLPK